MPFTYSGGGGPVGNRYFLGLYPLLLFVLPQPATVRLAARSARSWAALFTAQLVLNPFYTSFHPAEHAKRGLFRCLPVELSLLNDLPVNVTPRRVKQPLAGTPPVQAYFLDDNAYDREGEWFWVRGRSRADLILRAPVRQREDGSSESLRIRHLIIELAPATSPTDVTVRTAARTSHVSLVGARRTAASRRGSATAFRTSRSPTCRPTTSTTSRSHRPPGFTPMFTSGSRDSRFLGVFVRIMPVYE